MVSEIGSGVVFRNRIRRDFMNQLKSSFGQNIFWQRRLWNRMRLTLKSRMRIVVWMTTRMQLKSRIRFRILVNLMMKNRMMKNRIKNRNFLVLPLDLPLPLELRGVLHLLLLNFRRGWMQNNSVIQVVYRKMLGSIKNL